MTASTIGRQIAVVVATIVVSTACLVGAVGPAAVAGSSAPVAAQARA